MDASLLIDHQAYIADPAGGTVVRALLSIAGTAPAANRPALGLSLVLDRSGSMDGPPLESARAAAARAVERLHPDDVVSVVLFDTDIDTLAEPARCRDHHLLADRLRQVESGGSTNLSGGWLRGRQHMELAAALMDAAAGASRRVVLLTDGHANAGITDRETLVELARTARTKGVSTTTIGFGEGYDDDLLRAMADAGGGNAWYIERPDQAQDVFAEELGNLLSVAAQGLTVTLTLHPDVRMLVVHSDWPSADSGGSITFDLGDLYASEPKPLLFEMLVPAHATTAHIVVATLSIQAHVLTDGGGVEWRTLSLPIAATLDGQALMVPEVERAILMARSAKAREEAARRQREGDFDQAALLMRSAKESMASSSLAEDEAFAGELLLASADLARLEEQYREGQSSEIDAKYQMQRSYNERRGKRAYDARLRRGPGPS